MALLSSPLLYPPSSSPPVDFENHKRKQSSDPIYPYKKRTLNHDDQAGSKWRSPLASRKLPALAAAKSKGPFLDEDDEDDEDEQTLASQAGFIDGQTERLIAIDSPAPVPSPISSKAPLHPNSLPVRTSNGSTFNVGQRKDHTRTSYEKLIAQRSETLPGKATKSFYGIDIHDLIDQASEKMKHKLPRKSSVTEQHPPSPEHPPSKDGKKRRHTLWTEKYRARRFIDLVGDDRTHRDVLRWMKVWDPIVFPGSKRPAFHHSHSPDEESKPQRKILLLAGPPGLGKTTLAHVCAKQAGYEVLEINASDERTSQVVKGRIKDCVGTENVKIVGTGSKQGNSSKTARPVCVIVDEVDGVVTGSGAGGEGGFIKALMDLVALDRKNTDVLAPTSGNAIKPRRQKERFRLLRPLILVCNDIYHPSLRPLRTSNMAEVIHLRKPPLEKVVSRLQAIFSKEKLACDGEGVRKLCEATWGVTGRKEGRSRATAEGDLRGCLVAGEWAASKLRASSKLEPRLTRAWVEENLMDNHMNADGGVRGLGRGGVKEVVDRVFLDNAGFAKTTVVQPKSTIATISSDGNATGVAEFAKKSAMERLREMVDTTGESDRIVTDCFTTYPSQSFQDDTFLTKPNAVYEWLYFHDRLNLKTQVEHEWELGPYLPQSVLGFHDLFASPLRQAWTKQSKWEEDGGEEASNPFSGPRAHLAASEATKASSAVFQGLQSSLSIPLKQCFRAPATLAAELVPHLMRMLTPEVKPVVVGGSGDATGVVSVRRESERQMIMRATGVMHGIGVVFERTRVEAGKSGQSNWIYRMEPPLDTLATFETLNESTSASAPTRYAVRQAMDQEYRKYALRKDAEARQARYQMGGEDTFAGEIGSLSQGPSDARPTSSNSKANAPKRDFFGRPITVIDPQVESSESGGRSGRSAGSDTDERKAWVSFHEGFSNAVRKPITLDELMRDFETSK